MNKVQVFFDKYQEMIFIKKFQINRSNAFTNYQSIVESH